MLHDIYMLQIVTYFLIFIYMIDRGRAQISTCRNEFSSPMCIWWMSELEYQSPGLLMQQQCHKSLIHKNGLITHNWAYFYFMSQAARENRTTKVRCGKVGTRSHIICLRIFLWNQNLQHTKARKCLKFSQR